MDVCNANAHDGHRYVAVEQAAEVCSNEEVALGD